MTRSAFVLGRALAAPAFALAHAQGLAKVEVAFTPGDDVEALIARRIASARESVRMQAYLFTDPRLARALFAAVMDRAAAAKPAPAEKAEP